MLADASNFKFGVEGTHEPGRGDGCGFGFLVESVAHLVEQGNERNVFVEVEFDCF